VSADGNTAIVGGPDDNEVAGATWVFARSGGVWTQQGDKLVGSVFGNAGQGASVALSGDANTAIVGGPLDNGSIGAAWVFVQPVPSLQVTPTTNMVAAGNQGGPFIPSSFQYQLSATTGTVNYSITGVPTWLTASASASSGTANTTATTVTFTVNGNANSLAAGTYGPTTITFTNSDTGLGTQTRTATLTVNPPPLQVTPATNIVVSGTQGGPFSPSTFSYILSVASGSVNYAINVPPWLTPSSTTGTVSSSSPTTVTFTVNSSANSLTPNTYVNSISFNNTTNGQGNTTRVARLTVNAPPVLQVTPTTNMAASGTQGGPSSPSSFQYQLSASAGSINYLISGLPNWLTASPASGNVSSSGTTMIFTVNGNSLAPGTYGPIPITFNSDTGQGTQTRTATLTVNPPPLPALQVMPTANIVVAGNQGALGASSFPYALRASAGIVNYSISGVPNWLTPSSTSGNVSSSGTEVTFTVNASANSLAPGTYGPTNITFTSGTGQGTQTRTATLTVNPPALLVTPATGDTASGTHGGPFSPPSFNYALSATGGTVKYSITTPSWLTASSTSGTVTTTAKTITLTVNSSARSLGPGTHANNIAFNNTTNNQGNTTRAATLVVNPKQFRLSVTASPTADGTVSGAGTFAEGSSVTVTATPTGSHSFVNWTQNAKVVSTSASYTFTMPSANGTLTARFK
jgi:hypothetical protein